MERLRHIGAWCLLAGLLGLATLAFSTESFEESQDTAGLNEALSLLSERWRESDGMVVRPLWDDEVYQALSNTLQTSDNLLRGLLRGERLDPVDVLGFDRIWVLSRRGAPASLPELSASDITARESFDFAEGVSLTRLELVDQLPMGRMSDEVSQLKVTRTLKSGEVTSCAWRGDAHRCGLQSWLDVHKERRNVFHRDVSWIYAHAGPDGGTLNIAWPEAPRTKRLVVRAGFTQASTRNKGGTTTTLRIYIDDALTDEIHFEPHAYTQVTRVFSPSPGELPMRVSFEVSAEKSSWRQLMLEADLFNGPVSSLSVQRSRNEGKL